MNVAPGHILDCASIDVRVKAPNGAIRTTSGSLSIVARNLTVDAGTRIEVLEDPQRQGGLEVLLTGTLSLSGKLIANNAGSDSYIAVQADGSIVLSGSDQPGISVIGTQQSVDGGLAYLVSGGSITLGKAVFANGKFGGDENNVNAGGTVVIDAADHVAIHEEIRAFGRWSGGGDVYVSAGGTISIVDDTIRNGSIDVEGRSLSGYGGAVDMVAGDGITIAGAIRLGGGINNGGGEGAGGFLSLASGCGGIDIQSTIVDLTGGLADGGTMIAESDGPITIAGTIDARSRKHGGYGGNLIFESGSTLTLAPPAILNVDGHDTTAADEDGRGGLAALAGCTLDVQGTNTVGALVSASGAVGGGIVLGAARADVSLNQWSLRVQKRSDLSAIGTVTDGDIAIVIAAPRAGTCTNNPLLSCMSSSQCGSGVCMNANPNTEGVLTQFHPFGSTVQSTIGGCSARCNPQ